MESFTILPCWEVEKVYKAQTASLIWHKNYCSVGSHKNAIDTEKGPRGMWARWPNAQETASKRFPVPQSFGKGEKDPGSS